MGVIRGDIDKLLRSSVTSNKSDSSQWGMSSLSSMDFDKMPHVLNKFDQFLSIGNNDSERPKKPNLPKPKPLNKPNGKTPMQTIKEIPTPSMTNSSCSAFTVDSKPATSLNTNPNDLAHLSTRRMSSTWRDKPNTPKLFNPSTKP